MTKYRIIGNMTGNSMDAIDLVLTEFDGDIMMDICTYTKPYTGSMQNKMEVLRGLVVNKTKAEIEKTPEFIEIHNEYIQQIAECVNEMCLINNIDKKKINAIGFHGKTLDHNPPSKAKVEGTQAYTLQMGSGQMLANLTQIPVIYDFRSDFIMAGFEGAPLVPPHNAHIAATEGDGCYYNGGNTSNFALIINGQAEIGADAGPFNEYIDNYIRTHTSETFDRDGMLGKKGQVIPELLQELYNFGRQYYETPLPKSGDPAYYHKDEIFKFIEQQNLKQEDIIHTLEYFAAYIAVQALTLIPENIVIPKEIILFGGGWKNPIVRESFIKLLSGKAIVLPEHEKTFHHLRQKFSQTPQVRYSNFGEYMEARLFADLARYKLESKMWEIPEVIHSGQKIICGKVAYPSIENEKYGDCISRAAKGWQQK